MTMGPVFTSACAASALNTVPDSVNGFTSSFSGYLGNSSSSNSVSTCSVTASGSNYLVSLTLGGEVFEATVSLPTNGGTLNLTSTTDGSHYLRFTYGSAVASSITDVFFI